MNKEQRQEMEELAKERKDCTLEQIFERLEQLISDMEEETALEESFQMYHQGIELLKSCNDKIEHIEKQILILDEEGGTHEF